MREKVILVVDDDEMNLQISKMILEKKLACKVIVSNSGLKALEILRSQHINLVLLDVLMPDFDGLETLQEIRNDDKIKNVPVMMLTASADRDTVKKTNALGIKDYIRKPFLPKDLIERVAKKLAQEHSEEILIFGNAESELQEMQTIIEENFPHEVLTITSLSDAEKILNAQEITLIIACENIKFIDGFKLLELCANDERLNKIPFALTTPEKILELVRKINQPEPEKINPPEIKQPKIQEVVKDKKKIAKVVTNIIGYQQI